MKTRIVLVDDSALSRAVLKQILEAEGDIEVVGEAKDGFEAPSVVRSLKPDLVTMDVDMPGPNGLETISKIMQTTPVPILVVTGERLGAGSDLGFRAIECGALDFTSKPSIVDARACASLRTSVRVLSRVPVFVHVESGLGQGATVPPERAPEDDTTIDLIAIGSGTGGSRAIAAIVSRLPASLPCAVAIAQPTPSRFADAFVRYLQGLTPLRVVPVKSSHEWRPGEILVPASDGHLTCPRRGVIAASTEGPNDGHRPSPDVLLRSVADACGKHAVGVLVSGTGEDGVQGLASMHAAGARTVVESPETATPADAPLAAMRAGAVDRSISAELIADFLIAQVSPNLGRSTVPPAVLVLGGRD